MGRDATTETMEETGAFSFESRSLNSFVGVVQRRGGLVGGIKKLRRGVRSGGMKVWRVVTCRRKRSGEESEKQSPGLARLGTRLATAYLRQAQRRFRSSPSVQEPRRTFLDRSVCSNSSFFTGPRNFIFPLIENLNQPFRGNHFTMDWVTLIGLIAATITCVQVTIWSTKAGVWPFGGRAN
jgi:hypothetical protein